MNVAGFDLAELFRFLIVLPLLLISFIVHELAHALVATKLGDPTPRDEGRLTLNPLRHLDTWGTILLFATYFGSGGHFLFGWAKPVGIQPQYFKSPHRGMALVGLAGPAVNIAMALIAGVLMRLAIPYSVFVAEALAIALSLNLILACFNLIPIPPLDGSRVVGGLMPADLAEKWSALDRYGTVTLLALVLVVWFVPNAFGSTIGVVIEWAFRLFLW